MEPKQVYYATFLTPLDFVTIGWTRKGVRYVVFSDDAADGAKQITDHVARYAGEAASYAFDKSDTNVLKLSGALSEQPADLPSWIESILHAIEHPETGQTHHVPLDTLGTDFQMRVWDAIRSVPKGQTVTYSDLANLVSGAPRFARAVANACGDNMCAVLIPCHRVVGLGDLGGYRWGGEKKIVLLSLEKIKDSMRIGV